MATSAPLDLPVRYRAVAQGLYSLGVNL